MPGEEMQKTFFQNQSNQEVTNCALPRLTSVTFSTFQKYLTLINQK